MKRKTFFVLAAVLILSTIAVGSVMAQKSEPEDFLESPTSIATAGRFSSDTDDYIGAADYAGVAFKNWFAFASFDDHYKATLGYARYFGNIYVGLYYGGNMFWGYLDNSYAEYEHTFTSGSKKTFNSYTTWENPANSENENRFAVLIGVADMGFRISYASNHASFGGDDIIVGANAYKNYDRTNGWIVPQLQWGMTKPIMEKGIQPTVTFDLGFYRNFYRYTLYNADGTAADERVSNSRNFVQPKIALGLGGFEFYNGENFSISADLDYTLLFEIFRNDFSYLDGTKWKINTVKGINATGSLSEDSFVSHEITPSLSASYDSDRLNLSARFALNFDLISSKSSEMEEYDSGKLRKDGYDESFFRFVFQPELALGMQYKAIPGKLIINAGGKISAGGIMKYSNNYDYYNSGTKTSTTTTKIKSTSYMTVAGETGLYLGLAFNFNEHFGLEAVTGLINDNDFSVFGDGSFVDSVTTFGRILAKIKF